MRILLNDVDPAVATADPGVADLARLYAYPDGRPWLRGNMVSTLDGAATGPDGRSGSINDEADRQVFGVLRALADVVVVGAGTARAEGYRPAAPPTGDLAALRHGRSPAPAIAVVSRSGDLPPLLGEPERSAGQESAGQESAGQQGAGGRSGREHRRGGVLLATCEAAGAAAIDLAREILGEDHVLVLGGDRVDLAALRSTLAERDMPRMLGEGGPHLLRDMVAVGVVDELCLTVVPHLLAGEHPRILAGDDVGAELQPSLLLEAAGTLLGRWRLRQGSALP